jgi:Protein of unknown function (DUF2905)
VSPELGRILFVLGLAIAAIGLVGMVGLRLPLGRLPGDIAIVGKHVAIVIPLATSLLLSIVLTIVLNLIVRR